MPEVLVLFLQPVPLRCSVLVGVVFEVLVLGEEVADGLLRGRFCSLFTFDRRWVVGRL
jgi:hypothetical protein